MLRIRMTEADGAPLPNARRRFSGNFLLKRLLLEAITQDRPPVLLIDEVDRADEAFEAFLLEVPAVASHDSRVGHDSGAARATPSSDEQSHRELSDALRRRCLFLDSLSDPR
jgi:MoxR-like ATPase